MEEITDGLSGIDLESRATTFYEKAFNKIVKFAKSVRGSSISSEELEVTKTLAGPFTCGGILILLLEPRSYHPWREGTEAVIRDCKSLDILREGIQIGSKRTLSLKDDVSLLDLRPFLAKCNYTLEDAEWNKLYDLVFLAIKAKRPDVLLCMAKVRPKAGRKASH
jgi:hypothetical protein